MNINRIHLPSKRFVLFNNTFKVDGSVPLTLSVLLNNTRQLKQLLIVDFDAFFPSWVDTLFDSLYRNKLKPNWRQASFTNAIKTKHVNQSASFY